MHALLINAPFVCIKKRIISLARSFAVSCACSMPLDYFCRSLVAAAGSAEFKWRYVQLWVEILRRRAAEKRYQDVLPSSAVGHESPTSLPPSAQALVPGPSTATVARAHSAAPPAVPIIALEHYRQSPPGTSIAGSQRRSAYLQVCKYKTAMLYCIILLVLSPRMLRRTGCSIVRLPALYMTSITSPRG